TVRQRELGDQLRVVTKTYLAEKIGIVGFNRGKPFCGYKLLDLEEDGNTIKEYVDAICQEYYIKDQKLETGSAIGMPVVVVIGKSSQADRVISHEEPGIGDSFMIDVKRIFPVKTQEE